MCKSLIINHFVNNELKFTFVPFYSVYKAFPHPNLETLVKTRESLTFNDCVIKIELKISEKIVTFHIQQVESSNFNSPETPLRSTLQQSLLTLFLSVDTSYLPLGYQHQSSPLGHLTASPRQIYWKNRNEGLSGCRRLKKPHWLVQAPRWSL